MYKIGIVKNGKKNKINSFLLIIVILHCSFILYSQTSNENNAKKEAFPLEVKNKIKSLVEKGNLPSLQIAIVSKNEIIYSETFGENTNNSFVYMNGSIQKVFDATAILQLYEKGLIELDKDVNNYLPFSLRHPQYPDIPITIRMLLAHRSGLNCPPNQFEWDTENIFASDNKIDSSAEINKMNLEEYIIASLSTGGSNVSPNLWRHKPDSKFHYSIIAYPLLRYIVERVSKKTYPLYMKENIFEPLGMLNSGFNSEDFIGRHAIPFTRDEGKNTELPIWNGKGYMMRSTAVDMAIFMIAHINNGSYQNFRLLKPETIALMQENHSVSESIESGYGLGITHYKNNVLGHGGSTPGFQSLWSFKPSSQKGYILLTNVNGILNGQKNYNSVWASVSSIEKVVKSELGFYTNWNFYVIGIVLTVAGIIIILFLKQKIRIKKENTENYAT